MTIFLTASETNTAAEAATCEPADKDSGSTIDVPSEYEDLVEEAAEEAEFFPDVIAAQIEQESGWDENAESPASARGIAQFMPETWKEYGDGGDITGPEDAIPAQGRYMGELREMMEDHTEDQDELLDMSLAAYNAGPGALEDYDHNLEDMLADYSETRDYIPSIRAHISEDTYEGSCSSRYGLATAIGSPHDTGAGNDDYLRGRARTSGLLRCHRQRQLRLPGDLGHHHPTMHQPCALEDQPGPRIHRGRL